MQLMQEEVQKSTRTTWPRRATRSRLVPLGVLSHPVWPSKLAPPGRLRSLAGMLAGGAGTVLGVPRFCRAQMAPTMATRVRASAMRRVFGSMSSPDEVEDAVGGAGEDDDAQQDEQDAPDDLDDLGHAAVAAQA